MEIDSEKKLRRFYVHSIVPQIFHEDGIIVDANIAVTELCNTTLDNLIGQPLANLFPVETRAEVLRNIHESTGNRFIGFCPTSNGRPMPAIMRAKQVKDNGKTLGVLSIEQLPSETLGNTEQISLDSELARQIAQTLDEMRMSMAKQYAILESAVDAIITINSDGIIESANPATENMFGYTLTELIGKNISMLMPEPQRSHHDSYIQNYLKTNHAQIIGIGREITAQRKNGQTFSAHLAVSEIRNQDTVLFTGFIRDITQLRDTEAALIHSETRFRRSQQFANIGTWDWNIQTGELYWSERIGPLFGYDEGVLETTYENFLAAVHVDDREKVIKAVDNCIYHGAEYNIEHRVVWPNGEIRYMLERGDVVRDKDQNPLQMLGVVMDITPRKMAEKRLAQSEGQFRGAFETAPHGMAIVSIDCRCLKVNNALCSILGYTKKELVNSHLMDFSHPDDKHIDQLNVQKLINDEAYSYQVEKRYIHKSGHTLWTLVSMSLAKDFYGKPLHFVFQFLDITPRKLAEAQLIEAKEQAERANLAKSEFVSRMSHELRTPLNAVIGYAELLLADENIGQQQVSDISKIEKAGRHLLALINEILDLSRVEAGRSNMHFEPVDISMIIDECLTLLNSKIREKNLCFTTDLADYKDASLYTDKLRIRQVFLNLLSNAVKYNHPDGKIHLYITKLDGSKVRVNFKDNGPGIAADKLSDLFTPFSRLGMENSNIEGTGIGLALTKKLMEEMGGQLGVQCESGNGCHFWIDVSIAKRSSSPI